LPGANILPEPERFRSLEVVIVSDPDDAGKRAAENLRPEYAKKGFSREAVR
jgi:hypothetical protein